MVVPRVSRLRSVRRLAVSGLATALPAVLLSCAGAGAMTGCSSDSEPTPGAQCQGGFGAWLGKDKLAASQDPPCGLTAAQVPQFVSLGWDDNGDAEGMAWAASAVEARGGRATFFMTSSYGRSAAVQEAWRVAHAAGHELGNHTVRHADGLAFTTEQWKTELEGCTEFLTETSSPPVMAASELVGFRTPFLGYNDATLGAVHELGFWYDCSIEEGYQDDHDGTNFVWPYTLDERSPGHSVQVGWGSKTEITARPGLWELPVYTLIVPPDDKAAEYGIEPGLRTRLHAVQDWFDPIGGKITGFDYNLWAVRADGGFEMTKADFVATLKYSFDQRLAGNRAPFLLGVHSAYYVTEWDANAPGAPLAADRRAAIEEFLDYVKTKPEARIAPYRAVLDFMRAPAAI
jgi:peptidoglycan/xylan/chitin deacetylase (PgdA/CDA1 family)